MPKRVSTQYGGIAVEGLEEFRAELRALGLRDLEKDIRKAGLDVATIVADKARSSMTAGPGLGPEAAKTIRASSTLKGAQVKLGPVTTPRGDVIPATGVEFGAKQNLRRLIKNTRKRATIVRQFEDVDKVIRRVERQFIDARGRRTVAQAEGGMQVKVVRQMIGWNQFRPWTGNDKGAGYHLFPTIRESQIQIARIYGDVIDDVYRRAYPDGGAIGQAIELERISKPQVRQVRAA